MRQCKPSSRSLAEAPPVHTLAPTHRHSPSLILAMSTLPLVICRVACSAGSSWCRMAGSWSSAEDWACTAAEEVEVEEEEEDRVEGRVELRL